VRRVLRDAAAQSARIGVAEADFYPQIGVTGFLGYAASDIRRLFAEKSLTGLVLPTFSWRILNYGRVLNKCPGEIRCQFGKSGVSSSFLREKMNRHRIT
jgi:hypothetical protein